MKLKIRHDIFLNALVMLARKAGNRPVNEENHVTIVPTDASGTLQNPSRHSFFVGHINAQSLLCHHSKVTEILSNGQLHASTHLRDVVKAFSKFQISGYTWISVLTV